MSGVEINHQVVVFDAADLDAGSAAWAGVLGGTVDADDRHMVLVDGHPSVGVQLAPNHVPPAWPDGQPPQQIHLDLWVQDIERGADERDLARPVISVPLDGPCLQLRGRAWSSR